MNKRNMKSRVATLLAASMVATVLAPALPAKAETITGGTAGTVSFDLGIYGAYENKTLDPVKLAGTTPAAAAGDEISSVAPYSAHADYPVSGTKLYMPFRPSGTGKFGTHNFNFPGYKVEGWYSNEAENMGVFKLETLPNRFPAAEERYYPKFVSDGTTKFKVRQRHKLSSTLPGVTGGFTFANDNDLEQFVLTGFQVTPKDVPGFKLSSGSPTTKFYAPNTNFAGSPITLPSSMIGKYANYGIKKVNGYVSGDVVNKDLLVEYEYEIDNTVKFPLTIVHHYLQANGQEKHVPDVQFVPGGSFYTGEAVTGSAVKPDMASISATAPDVPRYVLAYDSTKANGIPAGTHNNFVPKFTNADGSAIGNKATVNGNKLLHPTDTGLTVNTTELDVTNANIGKVSGNMPNMGLQLHYYYVPNPNYALNVRVKYVDDLGQNITKKVEDKLAADSDPLNDFKNAYDSGSPSAFYKIFPSGSTVASGVEAKLQPLENFKIQAPELDQYTTNIETNITDGAADYQADDGKYFVTSRTNTNQFFNGQMGTLGKSIEITVKYTFKTSAIGRLLIDTVGDGQLEVMDNGTQRQYSPSTDAVVKEVDASNNIVLEQADLPITVPGLGYVFDGWYVGNNKVESWPVTISKTSGNYRIKAKFIADEALWKTFVFKEGNNDANLAFEVYPDPADVKVNTAAALASGGSLDFNYIDSQGLFPTVVKPANYDVIWQDENGNPVAMNDSLVGYADGAKFFAIASYTGAPTVNDPDAEGQLSASGVPEIKINNRNPVAAMKYVVVDNNGKVVGVVASSIVARDNGSIRGNFLSPDGAYRVYEADPGANINVGDDVSSFVPSEVSANPKDVTVPVANNANVVEDPTTGHRGKARIMVSPIAANTEYALVDDAGNTVYDFAAPSSTTTPLLFDNLDPNKNYKIVARPSGSTTSAADLVNAGRGLLVNTGNLGLAATAFDVTVVYPNGAEPTVKIGGVTKTLNDLKGLAAGTQVEITPAGSDANGNFFGNWNVVGAAPSVARVRGNTYVFTMPAHSLKLQPVYQTPASWSNAEYSNTTSESPQRAVGVVNPDIQEAGSYKIKITKSPLPAAVKANIDSEIDSQYKGSWLLHVQVLKEDPVTHNWDLYTGNVGDLLANVETGALLSSRDYRFFSVDIATNGVSEANSLIQTDLRSLDYQGSFDVNLQNDGYYAFGYKDATPVKVKIYDSRNGNLVTEIDMFSMETVGQHRSSYEGSIVADYTDAQGITHSYKGLSTTRDSYTDFDVNLAVTADTTLYLYYATDASERADAKRELEDAVRQAESLVSGNRLKDASRAALRDALNRVKAVLEKTSPRKASTSELAAALASLKAVMDNLQYTDGGNNNGGGGGGGGGGGSANILTQKTAKTNSTTRVYIVGTDGNWELTDANAHKWVFRLNSGTEVKGWNILTYQSNGQTSRDWYFFDDNGVMRSGWFYDTTANAWYYLSEKHDGYFGRMEKGWLLSENDNNWYYLNPENGSMHTGWLYVGEHWYFLNNQNSESTWSYNQAESKWEYKGNRNVKPIGAMYRNERTPDGYQVNADGVWNQ